MKGELTDRQREVYRYILDYISSHQYPPSIREVAAAFSVSVKAAYDHIQALERKGFISYIPRQSRSIEILNLQDLPDRTGEEILQLPILGIVAAGMPVFAEENYDGYLPVSSSLIRGQGDFFALKVVGQSMINAGILDGDYAVIDKCDSASNGTIVVARTTEGGVTLKRFYRESNRFRLEAENPAYPSIFVSKVQVLGKLKMIIRSY